MEGLTGSAYLFAFIGFLSMVITGWILIPRVSFVVTMAVFVHKLGLIELYEAKGFYGGLSVMLIIIMCGIGLLIDMRIIKDIIKDIIRK